MEEPNTLAKKDPGKGMADRKDYSIDGDRQRESARLIPPDGGTIYQFPKSAPGRAST